MKYVLASASPRRRELIRLLGFQWEILAANIDEDSIHHTDPTVDVMHTALHKARAVATTVAQMAVIVGADTTVILDDRKLDKPSDIDEARDMLRILRGREHQVHTGLAIIRVPEWEAVLDVATMSVPMRAYSDSELELYLASGDPLDKAGAYAIQHPDFRPVIDFQDCYAGVIGLPLCHLTRALRAIGISVPVDTATVCQLSLDYPCPVFERILIAEPKIPKAAVEPGSHSLGPTSDLA
ncbi:MAG: Maf family protein [Candidatus Promineifilaceae bacterium]|nr:Maf family protein [Candidatus Promineifilaceae bacterium]